MVRSRRLHGLNRHTIVLLLSVVFLSGALAGCTATDDDLDPDADGDPDGSGGSGDKGGGASGGGSGGGAGEGGGPGTTEPSDPDHYRYTDDLLEVGELSATGSFSVTEHCIPQCFVDPESYTQQVDLTDLLPIGVPTELKVDLQYDPEYTGIIDGYFVSDGAVWDQSPIVTTASADTIVAGRPDTEARVYYVVEAFLQDSADDNEWSLKAKATPLVDQIPAGFPVAFTVDDPLNPPKIRSAGLSDPSFMLYGPDDDHLGNFRSTMNLTKTFEESGQAGAYVLFTPWESGSLSIKALEGGPGTLRLLKIEAGYGDFQAPLPGVPSEWSFDVDRHPIAVGIVLRSDTGYMNIMSELRLESPETTLLSQGCGICGGTLLGTTERYWWFHGLADGVVPGTYDVFHDDSGNSEEAAEVVWQYTR